MFQPFYFQTYVVSLMLSFTVGILSPSLVIWSSNDARQQTYKVLRNTFGKIKTCCKRYEVVIKFYETVIIPKSGNFIFYPVGVFSQIFGDSGFIG